MSELFLLDGESFKKQILGRIGNLISPHGWAKKHGIDRGVMNRILHGKIPDPPNLIKLANVLNVTTDWLLSGEELDKNMMVTESPAPYYSDQEKEHIDKLLIILRNKDDETIKAITQNIDQFLRVPDKAPLEKKKAG